VIRDPVGFSLGQGKTGRIGFMVSGKGRLALEALRQRKSLGFEPSFILWDTGADLTAQAEAEKEGVPCFHLAHSQREEAQLEMHDILKKQKTDWIFLTFDRILGEPLLQIFPRRMINLHLSLLPAYPGMRALDRALADGVPFVGATMHLVTPRVDDGPSLAQCVIPVSPKDNRESIGERLFEPMQIMFLNMIRWAAQGRVIWRPGEKAEISGTKPGKSLISPEPEWRQ
jgi:phosphoribosylglycinamide formyltransferase-1